jgi:hypothetical protein
MNELTLADLAARIDALQNDVATLIREQRQKPERAYAEAEERIAVNAATVARMLSVKPIRVYQLHKMGVLNGFRPHPKSHMKFLVSEVRQVAKQMSDERRNT